MNKTEQIAIMNRLRQEGRYDAAAEFREETRRRLRDEGVGKEEAKAASWRLMAEEFPSLPQAEADDYSDEYAALLAKSATDDRDFVRDATWVYEHLEDKQVTPADAPSTGAWGTLQWARSSRDKFFQLVWSKVLNSPRSEDSFEEDQVYADLEQTRDLLIGDGPFCRSLATSVPDTIQREFRDSLTYWSRKHNVTLSDRAASALEREMLSLANRCIEAVKNPSAFEATTA